LTEQRPQSYQDSPLRANSSLTKRIVNPWNHTTVFWTNTIALRCKANT